MSTKRGHRLAGLSYELFARLHHFRLFTLMLGDLERILFEQLPTDKIEICFECTIDQVTPEDGRVRVLLDDGRAETADLVVGADGLHSRIRQLAFGAEDQFLRYLGFHTAAYLFQDAKIRSELGQNFVSISAPNRWVGFYPLRDDCVAAFFVHRAPSRELPADPCRELRRIHHDLGWVVPRALEH